MATSIRCWNTVLACSCSMLLLGCAASIDVRLPVCQEAKRQPRTSTICNYSGAYATPNATECTDPTLCETLSKGLPAPVCNAPSDTVNTSISDGTVNRSLYITLPGGCPKPPGGWPFLLFFGFDINGIRSTRSLASEILYTKEQLLAQGVAFVETSMYWNDTYDSRECNSFELGADVVSTGTCLSCETGASPKCEPKHNWFTCGNWEGSRDITMMRNLFSGWHERSATKDLDSAAMAYMGWSVGGHMVSRMIQTSTQSAVFPMPKAGVMISGASYQCYTCPAKRKPGEPEDEFQRCNWYSQGAVANNSIVTNVSATPCGAPFAPFVPLLQNKNGVCPGHTLYTSDINWWQMDAAVQAVDDPLLTEQAWDNCSKGFDEHPPVFLAQPWQDSDAYWTIAANYYEVLTRQPGAQGCRMYAGEGIHGPAPGGNQATVNFLLRHLALKFPELKEVTV